MCTSFLLPESTNHNKPIRRVFKVLMAICIFKLKVIAIGFDSPEGKIHGNNHTNFNLIYDIKIK